MALCAVHNRRIQKAIRQLDLHTFPTEFQAEKLWKLNFKAFVIWLNKE